MSMGKSPGKAKQRTRTNTRMGACNEESLPATPTPMVLYSSISTSGPLGNKANCLQEALTITVSDVSTEPREVALVNVSSPSHTEFPPVNKGQFLWVRSDSQVRASMSWGP